MMSIMVIAGTIAGACLGSYALVKVEIEVGHMGVMVGKTVPGC